MLSTHVKRAPADEPVYRFIVKKRSEDKPYYVYMTAYNFIALIQAEKFSLFRLALLYLSFALKRYFNLGLDSYLQDSFVIFTQGM